MDSHQITVGATLKDRLVDAFVAAFTTFVAAAFLFALFGSLWDMHRAAAATHWPTVEGVVTESGIQTCGRANMRRIPAVRYRYTVASQNYEGTRIQFGNDGCYDEQDAQRLVDRDYPKGYPVVVHFNPEAPEESSLKASRVGDSLVLVAIWALIMCCIAGPIAVICVRRCLAWRRRS